MEHVHHASAVAAPHRPAAAGLRFTFRWHPWPRLALAALLGLSAAVLLPLGVHNVAVHSDWAVADWLINYSGGFVRRGLTGSLALLAAHAGLLPATAVLGLQLALYALILVTAWHLLRPVRWTAALLALVFSPATLQFPLMDPNFAFRKEILFFALLSSLLLLLLRSRQLALPVVALLTFGCSFCVLSHEALLIFFPYLFGALCLALPSMKQAIAWALLPALASAVLFIAVSRHPGSIAISQAVCSSLGGSIDTATQVPAPNPTADLPASTNPGLCGGAIAYLSRPASYARGEVQRVAKAEHYSRVMPPLLALTLLPVLLQFHSMWQSGRRRETRIIATVALIAGAASVSLFLYGTDWTRWLYIHAFSLMLLLLFVAPKHSQAPQHGMAPQHRSILRGSPAQRTATALLLFSYVFAWHLSLYQPKVPFGGLIHYLHKTYIPS